MVKPKEVNISWLTTAAQEQSAGGAETGDEGIFQSSTATQPVVKRTMLIALEFLEDNPFQHRIHYVNIDSLAQQITDFGFQGTLTVRVHPTKVGYYQIAFGHRRKRAALMAGVSQIPVEVEKLDDRSMILLAVSENMEREDLSALEEGNSFLQLNEQFGMTQEEIAAFVGEGRKEKVSRGYVRNRLRAARMAREYPEIQAFLEQQPDGGYLRALAYLDDKQLGQKERLLLLDGLRTGKWTADTVADAVRILKDGGDAAQGLLNTAQDIPAREEDGNKHNGHHSKDQLSAVTPTSSASFEENTETLKRSSTITDALKRMQRYANLIGEAVPTTNERLALAELAELIQLILSRT
jgi:ParB/RepB/Spo0J family partition protein